MNTCCSSLKQYIPIQVLFYQVFKIIAIQVRTILNAHLFILRISKVFIVLLKDRKKLFKEFTSFRKDPFGRGIIFWS